MAARDKKCMVIVGNRQPCPGTLVGRDEKNRMVIMISENDEHILFPPKEKISKITSETKPKIEDDEDFSIEVTPEKEIKKWKDDEITVGRRVVSMQNMDELATVYSIDEETNKAIIVYDFINEKLTSIIMESVLLNNLIGVPDPPGTDLENRLVTKFIPYARVRLIHNPACLGTLIRELPDRKVLIKMDLEKDPRPASIGNEENYDLIFDKQNNFEFKKGQLVTLGIPPFEKEFRDKLLLKRVYNYANSEYGTIVDVMSSKVKVIFDFCDKEEWCYFQDFCLVFTDSAPKLNSCLVIPAASNSETFLGNRVRKINSKELGTITKITEDGITIWWDKLHLKNYTPLEASQNVKFFNVENAGINPGQIVTFYTRYARVRSVVDNALGTIIEDKGKMVSVLMDEKAWPLTFNIGNDNEFSLYFDDQKWVRPCHGQLVTKPIQGATVARSIGDIRSRRSLGTIFTFNYVKTCIIWHENENTEHIMTLPDHLRFAVYDN